MGRRQWLWGWTLAALLALAAGQASRAAPAQPAAPVLVDVQDNTFEPNNVAILAGQTVRWENKGFNDHNVVAVSGAFNSGPSSADPWVFEVTFDQPGVFAYFCEPHRGEGMEGIIEVKPALKTYLPLLTRP